MKSRLPSLSPGRLALRPCWPTQPPPICGPPKPPRVRRLMPARRRASCRVGREARAPSTPLRPKGIWPPPWNRSRTSPRRTPGGRPSESSADLGTGLLPQIVAQVPGPAAAGPGGPRALPTAEALDVRPRSRGGSRLAVHVDDSRLDPLEELFDLLVRLGEQPGGEAEGRVVGLLECLVEGVDRRDRHERDEQLLGPHVRILRGGHDRRSDIGAPA